MYYVYLKSYCSRWANLVYKYYMHIEYDAITRILWNIWKIWSTKQMRFQSIVSAARALTGQESIVCILGISSVGIINLIVFYLIGLRDRKTFFNLILMAIFKMAECCLFAQTT